MVGSGEHYIRKPVSHWSNEDVIEWLKGLGDSVQKDSQNIFEKEVERERDSTGLQVTLVLENRWTSFGEVNK